MTSNRCVLLRHTLRLPPESVSLGNLGPLSSGDDDDATPQAYKDLFVEYCQKGHAFPEDDIRTLECQFSRLVGTPVVVLYNAKTVQRGEVNMRACRLSTDITTGQHTKIYGHVLVLSSKDGVPEVTTECVQELDNAIHDELLEYYCQGVRPQPQDLKRIVGEYRAGTFRYTPMSEESTKVDEPSEENLPGWG